MALVGDLDGGGVQGSRDVQKSAAASLPRDVQLHPSSFWKTQVSRFQLCLVKTAPAHLEAVQQVHSLYQVCGQREGRRLGKLPAPELTEDQPRNQSPRCGLALHRSTSVHRKFCDREQQTERRMNSATSDPNVPTNHRLTWLPDGQEIRFTICQVRDSAPRR